MAEAVELAALQGPARVDWALGQAATFGRFGEGDVASILAAHPTGDSRRGPVSTTRSKTAPVGTSV